MTARLATFEWHTPPPSSVDEELALYDDGSAVLAVRRPRQTTATIGSYVGRPGAEDAQVLAASGPGPVVFDLLTAVPEAGHVVRAAADRVATDSLTTPRAVVTFHAHAALPVDGGRLGVTLLAIAAGTEPIEFELDAPGSSVHFEDQDRQPLSWQDLPALPTGFFTADAEGLGGILRPAVIAPGAYGAIAFEAGPPAGATSVSILVSGWITGALPDATHRDRFEVRTATAPIPG